ncbi:MAG: hypothetical protein NC548_26120 [Lachnospiraceae bacterium]|nr:hypothetical protein [Lachnospiraceae bacterium]
MKTKNYTRDYLLKSIKSLNKSIYQSICRVKSLEIQIKKEKKVLSDSFYQHDNLWFLRDCLNYENQILKMYKKDLKKKYQLLSKNEMQQKPFDTSKMTTMEVLGINRPELERMEKLFNLVMFGK